MKFQEWLALPHVQRKKGPVGDFACDAMREPRVFPDRNTKQAWRKHLFYAGACEGAIAAFESAWASYKRSQRAFAREESCVEP
jgi:YozE SAM-like fold